MANTVYEVTQSTDGTVIAEVLDLSYEEPRVTFDKIPRFTMRVPNKGGINAHKLFPGKEVEIRRQGELVFTGIISDAKPKKDAGGSFIDVSGPHKGYHKARKLSSSSFDFDEDGDSATTRDGVTVNPWSYFIYREPGGALDVYGQTPPVDGVEVDDAMRAFIGTRLCYQHDFQDNSHLLASQVYATTNAVQVFRDGASGDLRPKLQRIRQGDTFAASGSIESIPLINGDPFIEEMGDISSVEVVIVGELNPNDATDHPTIEVCRNAYDFQRPAATTRTYSSVTLAHSAAYNGSGLDAWTGTLTFADAPTIKNALGYKITIPGAGTDTTTTGIHYIKVIATTAADTGLGEGTIEAYDNPAIDGLGVDRNWVESDFLGFTRLEGIERLRLMTESDAATNSSPHWDAYIDGDLDFHFEERRGSDLTKEYSFTNGNITSIEHEYYGDELAYQTTAYGAGSGIATNRIVSKADYSANGGLYDSSRDPGAVTVFSINLDDSANETQTNLGASYLDDISQSFKTPDYATTYNGYGVVQLRRVGTPTGNVTLRLSTSTGSGGISSSIDAATLSTSFTPKGLSGTLELDPSEDYFFTVEYTGGDFSNHVEVLTLENQTFIHRGYQEGGGPVTNFWLNFDFQSEQSSAIYGDLPRSLKFVDSNETSAVSLLRKARAFHKLHRDPIESFRLGVQSDHIRFFSTGDSIQVKDLETRTNDTLRVIEVTRKVSGGGRESLQITLGEPQKDFAQALRNATSNSEVVALRGVSKGAQSGLAGNGVYFDKDHFGPYAFSVPDGEEVERVLLKFNTLPWQATSKAVNISGTTTDAGAAGVFNASFSDKSGTVTSTDYGSQGVGGTSSDISISAGSEIYSKTQSAVSTAAGTSDTITAEPFNVASSKPVGDYEALFIRAEIIPNSAFSSSEWTARILLRVTDGTFVDFDIQEFFLSSVDLNGTIALSGHVPMATLKALGYTNFQSCRVVIYNADSTNTLNNDVTIKGWTVPLHDHGDGSYATGTKNLAPGLSLDAAGITDLFSSLELGYTLASGGTGTTFTQGATTYYREHEHTFSGATADLDFGIYQFDGDSGDGTGSPIYGKDIEFAVDPTLAATGIPSTFATEKHPVSFGNATAPVNIEFDVTGYLDTDSNGNIKSGEHKVFFQGTANGTTNAEGLSVVSVTPIVVTREES